MNLYRVGKKWAIKAHSTVTQFETIEEAADVMVKLNVHDDEIDYALIDMESQGHTRANFGINGRFIMSDEGKLDASELV